MIRIYGMHLCFECMYAHEVCKVIGADDVLDVLAERNAGAAARAPHGAD
jgi:hypothetical protein